MIHRLHLIILRPTYVVPACIGFPNRAGRAPRHSGLHNSCLSRIYLTVFGGYLSPTDSSRLYYCGGGSFPWSAFLLVIFGQGWVAQSFRRCPGCLHPQHTMGLSLRSFGLTSPLSSCLFVLEGPPVSLFFRLSICLFISCIIVISLLRVSVPAGVRRWTSSHSSDSSTCLTPPKAAVLHCSILYRP